MTLLIVSIFLSIAYIGIMLTYLRGWRDLPEWHIPEDWKPSARVSVVVPARNESANIEGCLRSISEGSYPHNLLEIIVVDDFSDDDTAAVVDTWQLAKRGGVRVRLLCLSGFLPPEARWTANKKKSLEIGIREAAGEIIATTDADCVVPKDWLSLVVSRFDADASSPRSVLIAAPVAFHREKNLLQHFQSLDFLGLMGITGAGIHWGGQRMGNGANLAFRKVAFEAVGGYEGNEHLASGDDMFLMQKIHRRWPGSIFFLKNPAATVFTEAKSDWRSFLQQRLRWGTKNAALPEWPVRIVLLTVFLFCCSILLNTLLAVVTFIENRSLGSDVFFYPSPSISLLIQLIVKMVFDYIFLRKMAHYFKKEHLLRWFVPSFFLHTLYIPLVGMASLFLKKYEWKGRRVQ